MSDILRADEAENEYFQNPLDEAEGGSESPPRLQRSGSTVSGAFENEADGSPTATTTQEPAPASPTAANPTAGLQPFRSTDFDLVATPTSEQASTKDDGALSPKSGTRAICISLFW